MFHLLAIFFIIIIAVLLIGLSIVGTVLRNLFGLGRGRHSSVNGNRQQAHASSAQSEPEAAREERTKRKKLFTKEEGEYVDFEEIK